MNNDHRVQEPDHLIITVHGIRTFGGWQERLEVMLKREGDEAGSRMEVINYKYGYFSVLAFLIPPLRWLVTRRFRKALMTSVRQKNWRRIDIVAHSFGTHLSAWGLYGVNPIDRPHIHTLLFSGTVLKPGFPWRELLGTSVGRVINDCGIRDQVLVLNQLLVLFTGMAGRVGFSGMTGRQFRNRFFDFGHSGYFRNAGQDDDSFMEQYWLPLLGGEGNVEMLVDPRSSGPLSGFVTYLANNAEPVKLSIYMTVFLLAFAWIFGLYRTADEERMRAERQTRIAVARGLAAEARLAMEDSPTLAALLSAQALAATSQAAERPVPEAESSLRSALSSLGGFGIADFGGGVTELSIDDSGSRIASSGFDEAGKCTPVHLWRFSGRVWLPPVVLPGTSDCSSASLSGDGRRLLTVGRKSRPTLWRLFPDSDRVERVSTPLGSGQEVRLAELSPDGHWLALVAGQDGEGDQGHDDRQQTAVGDRSRETQQRPVVSLFRLDAEGTAPNSLEIPWSGAVPVALTFSPDASRFAVAFRPTESMPAVGLPRHIRPEAELRFPEPDYEFLREFEPANQNDDVVRRFPGSAVRPYLSSAIHVWGLPGMSPFPEPVRIETRCKSIHRLFFGHSGNTIAATCDGGVSVWRVDEDGRDWDRLLETDGVGANYSSFWQPALSPDENWLAITAPHAPSYAVDRSEASIWYLGYEDGIPQEFRVGIASSRAIFSPDSKWLALMRLDRVVIWDLHELLREKSTIDGQVLNGAVEIAAFTPDSVELVTGSEDRSLRVWSLAEEDWQPSFSLPGQERATKRLAISVNGMMLVAADDEGSIRARSLRERQPIVDPRILWGGSGPVYVDPEYRTYNLRTLDSAAIEKLIAASWANLRGSHPGVDPRDRVELASPKGRWLVVRNTLELQVGSDEPGGYYLVNKQKLAASPDWTQLICRGDRRISWDLRRGVTFSPDDNLAISILRPDGCERKGGIRFLDLRGGRPQGIWHQAAEDLDLEIVRLSPDGRWIAAGGQESGAPTRRVYLWDRERQDWWSGAVDVTPRGAVHPYSWELTFSPTSDWLLIGASKGNYRLVDLTESEVGQSYQDWPGVKSSTLTAAFSPDSRWLVAVTARRGDNGPEAQQLSSGDDSSTRELTARIWELERPLAVDEGEVLHVTHGSLKSSMDLGFSSSGGWLITAAPSRAGARTVGSGGFEVEAKVWQLHRGASPEEIRRLEMPISIPIVNPGWVFRFSPDERWLAIGREGAASALLMELVAEGLELPLALTRGRSRPGLEAFEFSPDGARLAVLGDGVSLWAVERTMGTSLSVFLPYERVGRIDADLAGEWTLSQGVQLFGKELAFSSDGRRLLAFGERLAAVWTIPIDELRVTAKYAVGRNLSWSEWQRYFGSKQYERTFSEQVVDSSVVQGLLYKEESQGNFGRDEESRATFSQLAEWSVELKDAALCNTISWAGAVRGAAREVGAAAECAVEYEPDVASYWDTRGLVRAISGDLSGALLDFRTFLKLAGTEFAEETRAMREEWVVALESGRNPIAPGVLEDLRAE